MDPYASDLVNFLLRRAKRALAEGDMAAYHKDFERAWETILRINPRAREAFVESVRRTHDGV